MNVTSDSQERQVVSRQRVADHGEVYTGEFPRGNPKQENGGVEEKVFAQPL